MNQQELTDYAEYAEDLHNQEDLANYGVKFYGKDD